MQLVLDSLNKHMGDRLKKPIALALERAIPRAVTLLDSNEDAAALELLKSAKKALEAGLQKHAKQAVFGGVSKVINERFFVRSLGSLAKQVDKVEKAMARSEGGAEVVKRCLGSEGSLRAVLLTNAINATTKYEVRVGGFEGSYDMLRLAWSRSRQELTKDDNELTYLLEKLTDIEKLNASEQAWKDVGETWQALLGLRSQMEVERGQAVLDCICADDKVLHAVGMADQLRKTQGEVPNDVLTTLNEGPGSHIRGNAYRYRKSLDRELARVRRVKEIQLRAVGFVGTAIVAALVGASNVIGRLYYDVIREDPRQAWMIAVGVASSVLLCVLSCCACYVCRRGVRGRPSH